MARGVADGITIAPRVMVGKPVIAGTRLSVELILGKLAANPSLDELFLDPPELTLDQVRACLRYATRLVREVRPHDSEALTHGVVIAPR